MLLTDDDVRELRMALKLARDLADWASRMQSPGPRNGNSVLSTVERRAREIAGLLARVSGEGE